PATHGHIELAADLRVAVGSWSLSVSCPHPDGGRERGGLSRSRRHCDVFSWVMRHWGVSWVDGVCSRAEPSLPAVPLSRPVIPTASSGGEGSVPLSATSSILSVGFGPGDGQCRFSDQ